MIKKPTFDEVMECEIAERFNDSDTGDDAWYGPSDIGFDLMSAVTGCERDSVIEEILTYTAISVHTNCANRLALALGIKEAGDLEFNDLLDMVQPLKKWKAYG